jgi:PKD repeat protein
VPVKFKSRSSDPDSGVTLKSFAFAFGDGRSARSSTATHAFKKPGTYTVTLAVTNSLNLQSMVSHTIKIAKATIKKLKLGKVTGTSATIIVKVNAPGKLVGVGKTQKVSKPGTYKLKLKFAPGTRTIKLKLRFVPAAGKAVEKTLVLHL